MNFAWMCLVGTALILVFAAAAVVPDATSIASVFLIATIAGMLGRK